VGEGDDMSTTPILDQMIALFPGIAAVRKALVEPEGPGADAEYPDMGAVLFENMPYNVEGWHLDVLEEIAALKARGPQPMPVRDATVPASWLWGIVGEGSVILKEETYVKPAGGIAPDASGDWVNPLPAGTKITIGERASGSDPGFARIEYPQGFTELGWTLEESRRLDDEWRSKALIVKVQKWVNKAAHFTHMDWRQARLVAKGLRMERIRLEWVRSYPDSIPHERYHILSAEEQLSAIEAAEAKMAANT
jgi:hypothetical protein